MTRMSAEIQLTEATPADLPEVRVMLREYAEWLAVDLSFQDFAREVAGLPGDYARPRGGLLIARSGAEVVGMVAFRRRGETTAEMKRLYVRPAARGLGVGRLLVARIIAAAREAGCQTMVLDTLPVMGSAHRLYEAFGFRDVPAYYASAVPGTRYMALALSV
jgi:GNAT superfamily N-acetyltransferase